MLHCLQLKAIVKSKSTKVYVFSFPEDLFAIIVPSILHKIGHLFQYSVYTRNKSKQILKVSDQAVQQM